MQIRAPRFTRAPAVAAASLALVVLASSSAGAQPGAPPPPPPGYGGGGGGYYYPPPPDPYRRGLTLGVGIGLGAMNSDSALTECFDCNYDPIAVSFDFHIGGMINPQLAILGEVYWHAQNIDADGFNWLSQGMLLGAVQFWVTPQLWLKGGLGFATLDTHYDDGYEYDDQNVDTGVAVLGAAGFEVLSAPWFSVDIQARLATGSYDGIDEQVSVGTVGVGFNWY
jgi:hypothetical protein